MPVVNTPQSRCRAGVSRGDITPPISIYHRMWGAAMHDRAEGVHLPLLATVLWLEPYDRRTEEAVVIIALDHCILDGAEMINIRHLVARSTGVRPDRVQVALSHTHGSGWMSRSRSHFPGGDLIGPYLDHLAEQCARLVVEAQGHIEPVTFVYGSGKCDLATYRDFWDAERGYFVCGFDPAGRADDTLLVVRLVTADRRTLATVVNYACHLTTLAWQNRLISPDWVGAMRERIEGQTGGPCLFLQGASGDLGPKEGFVGDPAVADRNGRKVGYAALAVLETLPEPGTRFVYAGPVISGTRIGTWQHEPLEGSILEDQTRWHWETLVIELAYRPDLATLDETRQERERWLAEETKARAGTDPLRIRDCRAKVEQMTRKISVLEALPSGKYFPYTAAIGRLGDALWLFLPGELYQAFQLTIRERFPQFPIIISTVTNDWQPGYLPTASTWGYGIYQEVIAILAPGCLELLIEAITRKLRSLC